MTNSKNSSSTIRDVARLAGVSVATVSRYINHKAPLAADTAARVQQAMDELSFFPHPVARSLATQHTNTIGLLLLDIGGEFYTPMLRGIEAAANEAGYDLLIHTTRTARPVNLPRRALNEYNTDGLLAFTDALDDAELARLHAKGFPVVLMHQNPPRPLKIPVVTIENRLGAQQIVDHLIEVHGRRRIAFLRGPDGNQDSTEREKGYLTSLKNHGLEFDPSLVTTGGFETDSAYAAAKGMLATGASFDAIFTGDDDSAAGVIRALNEAGMRVPQDVAIGGFDDSIISRLVTPNLTTVKAPIERVGHEAVTQLLHLIKGEPAQSRTVLPVELILRHSCGC